MNKKRIAALGMVAALAVTLTGCGIRYDGDTTGCTITGKYVAVASKQSEKRIETTCGIFKVEDELSKGWFNSADLYASLTVGKTYDFEVYGWRNGFLSAFPNVAAATEVAK